MQPVPEVSGSYPWPPLRAHLQGTIPGSKHAYVLDDHHTFQAGKW